MLNMSQSKYYREQIKNANDNTDEKSKIVRDYVRMCRSRNKNIDLSGLDLSNVDLSDLDLSVKTTRIPRYVSSEHGGYYTYNLKICKVRICNTNLQGANLSNCNFNSAKMDDTNIAGAKITGAHGWPYKFYRDKIEASKNTEEKTAAVREYITNCTVNMSISIELSNLDLSGTDLSNLDLSGKTLHLPIFFLDEKGQLIQYHERKIRKVRICNTNLQNANLSNCNFGDAKMNGTDLTGANRTDTSFENLGTWEWSYLKKIASCQNSEEKTQLVREFITKCQSFDRAADLSGRDLSGVDLSNLDLRMKMGYISGSFQVFMRKTNLQGANLTNTNLNGVNMKGSNLKDAKIEGANLEYTKQNINEYKFYREQINSCTNSDEKSNLVRDYVKTCYALNKSIYLNDVNLSGIDLSGLDLSKKKVKRSLEYISKTGDVEKILVNKKTIKVHIQNTDLQRANLSNCNFTGAKMHKTNLQGANTEGAIFDKTKGVSNEYNNQNNHNNNNCVMS